MHTPQQAKNKRINIGNVCQAHQRTEGSQFDCLLFFLQIEVSARLVWRSVLCCLKTDLGVYQAFQAIYVAAGIFLLQHKNIGRFPNKNPSYNRKDLCENRIGFSRKDQPKWKSRCTENEHDDRLDHQNSQFVADFIDPLGEFSADVFFHAFFVDRNITDDADYIVFINSSVLSEKTRSK